MTMTMHATNNFRVLWNKGYKRLLPVVPHDDPMRSAGKRPGEKNAGGKWVGGDIKSYDASEALVEKWWAMGAGVGFRCDRDIVGVDIDVLNSAWAERVMEVAVAILGQGVVRIGRAPKSLLMFRPTDRFKYRCLSFDQGMDDKAGLIELLAGEGKWFVAEGIHPETLKPYYWPNGIPALDDVPFVTPEQVDAFFSKLAEILPNFAQSGSGDRSEVPQDRLKGDPDIIAMAMKKLPNQKADYFEYVKVAAACKAATVDAPDVGLDAFVDWSDKLSISRPKEKAERVYNSLRPPYSIGADYIYSKVDKEAGTHFMSLKWSAMPAVSENKDGSLGDELFGPGEKKEVKLFDFTPFNDAAGSALSFASKPLIKGLLDQGAMTVLYGESNAGKTFVAMDIAYAIAKGVAWSGMRTTQFPVLYVAAEGGLGARKRAAALSAKHGACDAFSFLMHPVNLLRADADLEPLIASIKASGLTFGLVVVDTLSRVMAGGDENGSVDMGAMVKHLDRLRSATGAHIMVVHHSGKDRAKGARGHSLLRAATDTEIEIADREISVTKQRDLDGSFIKGFDLEVIELGRDADGDAITSCVIRLLQPDEVAVVPPTPRENDVLRALEALQSINPAPDTGVSVNEIVAILATKGVTMTPPNVRFYLASLYNKSITERVGKGKWGVKEKKNQFFATDPKRFFESEEKKGEEKMEESAFS